MHRKLSVRAQQHRRVRGHAESSDAYAFFDLLTSAEWLSTVESLLPAHRERLFPPTATLALLREACFCPSTLKPGPEVESFLESSFPKKMTTKVKRLNIPAKSAPRVLSLMVRLFEKGLLSSKKYRSIHFPRGRFRLVVIVISFFRSKPRCGEDLNPE